MVNATVGSVLTAAGEGITQTYSWAADAGNVILESPLLSVVVLVPLFAGLGIGLFKRLFN